MSFAPNLGNGLDAASGVLLVVLGIGVATLRPRNATSLLLAAFNTSFGLSLATNNLTAMLDGETATWNGALLGVSELASHAGAVSLLLLLARIPMAPARAEVVSLLVAGGIVALVAVEILPQRMSIGATLSASLLVALELAVVLIPLRYGRAGLSSAQRRNLALVAAAVIPWPALSLGVGLQSAASTHGSLGAPAFVLSVWIASSILWLVHVGRLPPDDARAARHVLWFQLGAVLASFLLAGAMVRGGLNPLTGPPGVARTATVLLLAYAILRHRLLGIDVKLRWTISKATIAAAFVAAFFVASEAAQQFLGATFDSAYLGIAAAGALVFALAPLQRAAEKLAAKAVPTAADAESPRSHSGPEAAFRSAVRVARHDGAITGEEDRYLAEVADALGLTHAEASRVRREVEDETRA